MASSKQDFKQFVRWLHQPEKNTPINVRKLANLALSNFDDLSQTTRHKSSRTIYLANLMRHELEATEDNEPVMGHENEGSPWLWTRLNHLTLGPFRGFRTPEPFDISKKITLFYGPNGSGKTSLCEGLEYALLGEVEEAGSKRIAANTYLKNAIENRFEPPQLTANNHDGEQVNVVSNPESYRFCFVERNRIDSFSRMAARPSGQRSELIATLFGMEQFNDFVSHFNESIDGKLVLNNEYQAALISRRTALTADQTIVANEADSLTTLVNEEQTLAISYSDGTTYEALNQLIGSEEVPGRLHELNHQIEAIPPRQVGLTRENVRSAFESVQNLSASHDEITIALHAMSDQVSYKALYNSVLALQEVTGDRCPACDTPLDGESNVQTNPFDKATDGLEQLRELTVLEEQKQEKQVHLERASRTLRTLLGTVLSFLDDDNEDCARLKQYLELLPDEPTGTWWLDTYPATEEAKQSNGLLIQLYNIAEQISQQDEDSQQAEQQRQLHIEERQGLIQYQLLVQAQDLKRQQYLNDLRAAKQRIEEFDEANAELIALAEQEKINIERDRPYKTCYDQFLEELKLYRAGLPAKLMEGLNEATMEFYNSFNRNDREEDKLSSLRLPLDGNGKIEIFFRGNPKNNADALHVLSEGHIRCLGLAILLAKAKSIGCPVIVFDDAINAIDHDHRGGIRETIFESDIFADTQLIVTCHSNEFIKDIQQHLPVQRRRECTTYLLRHHNGNYQPRVTDNVPCANYIAKARSAREILDDRAALASSRQALEMISEKVWRWLGSHGHGVLNLMLPGVGAEPGLRDLCNAITKKLRDARTFEHANKQTLLDAYRHILGIPENNLVWIYLNKGTHEEADRDDFDGEQVELIVRTLESIDQLDLRPSR
jgi:recombinational DNA repair ATPase RecF